MSTNATKTAKRNTKPAPKATNKAKATKSGKKTATNKPAPKAKPATQEREVYTVVRQNGQTQPKAGTTCAAVWALCDLHNGTRAAIIKAGLEAGINEHTVKTQFARWRTFNGITGRAPKATDLAVAQPAA